MASGTGSVWALDIGNNALKALRLTDTSRGIEVTGFECINYGKILSGSGVKPTEREELIAFAVRQFVKSNDIGKDNIIVSVPGQNSFARFVKLPPFDKKQIPEMVKYEAAQQIPFDMNDVQWDWQLMTEPDDPEAKVGLFAIKTDIVTSELEYFSRENLQVSCVQMVPMALYNYLVYDRPELTKSDTKATVVINIGAENSDLIVCTKSLVWQRSIPMGGNAFTRAIADAFKLNFTKAEKLKRTAAMSKYARQIFQAMKPVFTDFASEVQRSLGFYSSSNPDTSFTKLIALGGGIKMRGLLKYLQQTLQIPVESPDSFKKLKVNPSDQAKFHENVNDFAVVYGLALQGLGLARIESDLLPTKIARQMNWKNKTKFFILAACMLLAVSVASLLRANLDRVSYNGNASQRRKVDNLVRDVKKARLDVQLQHEKAIEARQALDSSFAIFSYRDVIPRLHETIINALPNAKNNPQQKELYEAFANKDIDLILSVPRKQRKQLLVTSFTADFVADVEMAAFGTGKITKKTRTPSYEREMEYAEPRGGRLRKDSRRSRRDDEEEQMQQPEEELGGAGFIVTITGYSPYRNINELLDPVAVENNPEKWGFITRLMHLDEIVDGNSPFVLFGKTDPQHFSSSTGVVTLDSKSTKMPDNIGVLKKENVAAKSKNRQKGKDAGVLVDSMTGEVISQQVKLNEEGQPVYDRRGKAVYEVHDNWFILKAKFVWKDAPKASEFEEEQEDSRSSQRRPGRRYELMDD
ncbi:MAG: type IV pilus assembly protein PilM [Planctomycetes bacterium]|nr:type IV pilus assembly protein PilM [Planctomycetota bacterium]